MPDDKTVADHRKERVSAIVGGSPFLTFTNVRIFESVVRHESFSRAAEELRVSQPYISAQIAGLETKLGIELFRRVGRRAYVKIGRASCREGGEVVVGERVGK